MFPFNISPSDSGLVLHTEEDGGTYIEFEARNQKDSTRGRVKVTFERCFGARLCSMSGEAAYGLGIINNSKWLLEMSRNQKKYYPRNSCSYSEIKHYYFRGHDSSVEVLAEGLSWVVINEFKP